VKWYAPYFSSRSRPHFYFHAQWEVQELKNGRYRLVVRKAATAERDNLLWALLIEEELAEEWVITKRGPEYTEYT
jgi:hypothetical protein